MKKKSIRTILLRALLGLMIVTLGLISVIFSVMQYRTLKKQATTDMQDGCRLKDVPTKDIAHGYRMAFRKRGPFASAA